MSHNLGEAMVRYHNAFSRSVTSEQKQVRDDSRLRDGVITIICTGAVRGPFVQLVIHTEILLDPYLSQIWIPAAAISRSRSASLLQVHTCCSSGSGFSKGVSTYREDVNKWKASDLLVSVFWGFLYLICQSNSHVATRIEDVSPPFVHRLPCIRYC